jgi:hypothetical protein
VRPSDHRGTLARTLHEAGLEPTEQLIATFGKLGQVGEFIAFLRGIRIVAQRELAERLERDTFSGGYNRSARERNQARLEEERKRVYFDQTDKVLVCPPRVVDDIRATLALQALKQERAGRADEVERLRGRLAYCERNGLAQEANELREQLGELEAPGG